MTRQTATTVTSANGATGKNQKNQKGEFNMAKSATITITEAELKEIITKMAETLVAGLSQAKSNNEVSVKVTPKKTAKTAKTATVKVNPVKEKIEKEQKELAERFGGKDYGSQTSGDFVAFYRRKDNGSYTRLGHFNKAKGLFWFTKKSLAFRDWSYIKHQLSAYSNKADFVRNADRFARAGIKCPSDFTKVSWETFLNSGVFC